jgi:hypothetical protein
VDFKRVAVVTPHQNVRNDISRMLKEASEPQSQASSSTTSTTQVRIAKYQGEHAGGELRQQPEAKGESAAKKFEADVTTLLERYVKICAADRWYCITKGYLCSDGIHLIHDKDIDRTLSKPGHKPTMCMVNIMDLPDSFTSGSLTGMCHPLPLDYHYPMHARHWNCFAACAARGYKTIKDPEHPPEECECTVAHEMGSITKAESDYMSRMAGFDPDLHGHSRVFNSPRD